MSAKTAVTSPLKRLPFVSCGLLALFALLTLAGCVTSTPTPTSTLVPPTPTPQPTNDPSVITLNVPLTPGPGTFYMPDVMVGLDKLTAYHATLVISFAGTRDGKSEKWSKTTSMLVTSQPAARRLTTKMTTQPDENITDPLPQTELGGILYSGGDKDACAASVVGPDVPSLSASEPAALLPGVLGADEAGDATVNQVASKHYTFDEKALALNDGAAYTGEVWVAADGGYVVKYVLSGKGGPDVYGEGVEGTTTWEYNLTDANKPAEIALPAGCPPGQLDVDEMPGAENVVKSVGQTSFTLPSATIDDVLAYYKGKLTAAGWAAGRAPQIEPGAMGSAGFTKGDLETTVIVWLADGVTHVTLSLASAIPNKVVR